MKDWTGNSRSMLCTVAPSNHSATDRAEHDYYATEPRAIELLLGLEKFSPRIWEPACGAGHMANVLAANGYEVKATDLIDRGFGTGGIDFLAQTEKWDGDIITNPPYKFATEFVEKALELVADGAKVAMFLKLTFLEGKTRRAMFNSAPPPARLGVVLASAVLAEREADLVIVHYLCLVRVAKGPQGRHDSEMVQLKGTYPCE